MKILRYTLCFLLILALLSGAALAETYTDDWGNGITLNFEIDDSLLQPLDIFDAHYKLPLNNASDAQMAAAKDLINKAAGIIFNDDTPLELHKENSLGSAVIYAYNGEEWGDGNGVLLNSAYISCTKFDETVQYLYMESYIDNELSEYYPRNPDYPYPAERKDFYVEHDYMTHEEADAKARDFMSTMRGEDSPFDVVLRDWYGITHEQFSDFFDWATEHDMFKQPGVPSYFAGNDWTEKYDAYYLLYSYTYKGYPICDNVRTNYYGTADSAANPAGYIAETLINRDGFVYSNEAMLLECDYTPYQDTPALTLYEALDVLKNYLGGIKMSNPIEINRVYVEYLPYYIHDGNPDGSAVMLTFEPIWSFVTDMTTKYGRMENYMVYRVNARTGEIMTNGTGVIE